MACSFSAQKKSTAKISTKNKLSFQIYVNLHVPRNTSNLFIVIFVFLYGINSFKTEAVII